VKAETIIREWLNRRARVPELGERHIVCDWVRPEDGPGPWIDENALGGLYAMLPDKIVTNLQRARDAQAGRIPMLKAGLGYEECLSAIIVDGTAIASSSTESLLIPANLLPANYLQPGGIPGRSLSIRARGRETTLTTAATLTFRWGSKTTTGAPITTPWCASGALVMDTSGATNNQWRLDAGVTVRSVGASGTVFAQGDAQVADAAATLANQRLSFMGSAGSATPAAVTVDMTVPQFLMLTAQWSLTTAYSITCHRAVLEALN
jgi:hypothetical protein